MSNKVEMIKKWALENYSKSYGASSIIECFEDSEIEEEFDSLKDAKEYASLQDEQYSNCF